MFDAIACAKVNLSLRVAARRSDGLHALDGIFQSIGWVDRLSLEVGSGDDRLGPISGEGGAENVIDGWDNLVWKAVGRVRTAAGSPTRVSVGLDKHVPVAAGLGGGSADAAAALAVSGLFFGVSGPDLVEIGATLGSDVPFCLAGGTARVTGTGAELEPLEPVTGFALALVVPPIEMATGQIYSRWDELGGPAGPQVAGHDLPPQLRSFESLANDLYPAAVAVAPVLDDWRAELAARWGRPVLLTGSGPTMFSFFVDRFEAADALDAAPTGARATAAVVPVPFGWAVRADDGSVTASSQVTPDVADLIKGLTDNWY